MKKKNILPDELLVYVIDYDNGQPIYAVVSNVNDIPEECDGEPVGAYHLNNRWKFRVRRELV